MSQLSAETQGSAGRALQAGARPVPCAPSPATARSRSASRRASPSRRQARAAARALARALAARDRRHPRLGRQPGADRRLPRRASVHSRLAPRAGPARAVFEAVERARVEALGANRMPGMAANLTARIEDQYGHGRYAEITSAPTRRSRTRWRCIVRERLTGAAAARDAPRPWSTLWRPSIEERGGQAAEAPRQAGRGPGELRPPAARSAEERSTWPRTRPKATARRATARTTRRTRGRRRQRPRTAEDGEDGQDQPSEDSAGEGEAGEAQRNRRDAERDDFDADADGEEMDDAREPWRPNTSFSITPRPSATRSSRARTTRRSAPRSSPRPTSWSGCAPSSTRSCAACRAPSRASPTGCSAGCWRSRTAPGTSISRKARSTPRA